MFTSFHGTRSQGFLQVSKSNHQSTYQLPWNAAMVMDDSQRSAVTHGNAAVRSRKCSSLLQDLTRDYIQTQCDPMSPERLPSGKTKRPEPAEPEKPRYIRKTRTTVSQRSLCCMRTPLCRGRSPHTVPPKEGVLWRCTQQPMLSSTRKKVGHAMEPNSDAVAPRSL